MSGSRAAIIGDVTGDGQSDLAIGYGGRNVSAYSGSSYGIKDHGPTQFATSIYIHVEGLGLLLPSLE